MRILLVVTFVLLLAAQDAWAQTDSDFSRVWTALGTEIALADRDGLVREGILTDVTADEMTMRFGSVTRTFARTDVMSVDRLKDRSNDGFMKGAIFGAVVGAVPLLYGYREDAALGLLVGTLTYGAIGWAIDAAITHREPVYRAQSELPKPGVKLSLRF